MDARVNTMARAAAWTLWISAPTVLESLAGTMQRAACDERLAWWSRRLLDDVGVKLEVSGAEHLEPRSPMLVMSNHQSLYDIPVLYQVLPPSVRMVSKVEIFRIPIFGQAMRAAEFIEVDRKNPRRAIKNLKEARRLFESGVTVWIAPEGTRSPDGTLGAFKKGGFILAEEAEVPILPVTIDGTLRILPPRTTDLHLGQTVKVTIHRRVTRDEVADREEWVTRVRESIAAGLNHP